MRGAAGAGWVRARAPAKVNLALDLIGRRPDGYFELETWMLAVDLEDELEARASADPGVRLQLAGPFASADVPSGASNLAVRAAELALAGAWERGEAGGVLGLDLRLVKRIPSRAGLGGGSSDAAAAWLAARAALGLGPAPELAHAALARLGSDCAFFAEARAGLAVCRGRGEIVQPVPGAPPPWWIPLVLPGFGAETAAVYARALPGPPGRPTFRADAADPPARVRNAQRNDLEAAALAAVPALGAWRASLDACGLEGWRLSGSGSAWFGLCASESEARAELARLGAELARRDLVPRLVSILRPAGAGARVLAES
jgi:4-diphosphocytidyl-2-C-methyl-D-erythritol kinase